MVARRWWTQLALPWGVERSTPRAKVNEKYEILEYHSEHIPVILINGGTATVECMDCEEVLYKEERK